MVPLNSFPLPDDIMLNFVSRGQQRDITEGKNFASWPGALVCLCPAVCGFPSTQLQQHGWFPQFPGLEGCIGFPSPNFCSNYSSCSAQKPAPSLSSPFRVGCKLLFGHSGLIETRFTLLPQKTKQNKNQKQNFKNLAKYETIVFSNWVTGIIRQLFLREERQIR